MVSLYSVEKMWLRHWGTAIHKSHSRPCGDRGQNGEQIVHRQWDPSDTHQQVGSLFPSLYDQQVEVLNVTSSDDAVKYRLVYSRGRGDVTKRYTTTSSGEQQMTFINESGLYSLILSC